VQLEELDEPDLLVSLELLETGVILEELVRLVTREILVLLEESDELV
jgi:hypothetical protein